MTDKSAIRAEAVGQDFGADTAEFDPSAPVTEAVEQDHRGTVMVEFESYERIVEGMKLASDGARQMVRYGDREFWNKMADTLDALRRWAVVNSGYGRMEDGKPTALVFGGVGIARTEAISRLNDGMHQASKGAEQIGLTQRKDVEHKAMQESKTKGYWLQLSLTIIRCKDRAHQCALTESTNRVNAGWGERLH